MLTPFKRCSRVPSTAPPGSHPPMLAASMLRRPVTRAPHRRTDRGATSLAAVLHPRWAGLLDLQRDAGNGAVTQLLQRQVLERTAPTVNPRTHPLLVRGASGDRVRKLQQMLNARGHEPPLKVDGGFGPLTQAAVKQFQHDHDLEDDGKVGPLTWAALEEAAGTREIDANEEQLGAHAIAKIDENNLNPHTLDEGVHYDYNYKALLQSQNRMDLWKDSYYNGFADPQYFEHLGFMDWRLKPRMSASAALKSWLRGLTIAECQSALIPIEYDSMRAAMGDSTFDEHFGSTEKSLPRDTRLRIKTGYRDTPLGGFMQRTDAAAGSDEGTKGNRPAKPGEWFYF